MKFQSLLLFILFCSISARASEPNCSEIFSVGPTIYSPNLDRVALSKLVPTIASYDDITMAQVKAFSSFEGALNLLTKFIFRHDRQGLSKFINMLYFNVFRESAFDFNHIIDLQGHNNSLVNIFQSAKKGDWTAKKSIIISLLTLQQVFRVVFNDPELNLLTEAGLFKVTGATDLVSFNARLDEADKTYGQMMISRPNETPVRREVYRFMADFSDVFKFSIRPSGYVFGTRSEIYKEQTPELIKKLHLPQKREQYYLELLEDYKKIEWLSNETENQIRWSRIAETINFFLVAYVERFPSEGHTSRENQMSAAWFLSAIRHTDLFDRVHQLNEYRLTENLDLALSINEQISNLESDVDSAIVTEARLTFPHDNYKKDLLAIRDSAEALRVQDLTADALTTRVTTLQNLQFELSQTVEKLMANVDNENVHSISELNFTWSRVVVNKSYEFPGKDFDHVVFEKDILHFLKHEQEFGDRFLVALNKGYVGQQGESGIRYIPEIHKELRYLKLNRGRKLRLIGRIQNRTLYFFYVYDRNENFDNTWLRNLIENHDSLRTGR